jgi:membrane protease YdiL (CAAX protease family)
MHLRGTHAGRPAFFQLALLLGFVLAGILLAGIITIVVNPTGNLQDPGALRIVQSISSLCTFLTPALLIALLCSTKPEDYLFIKRFPDVKTSLLTLTGVLLLSPAITLTGVLNKSVQLPLFMEQFEKEAEKLTAILFADTGLVAVLLNLLVIAVLAAITEEFFFRGALLRIMGRWFKNHHVVIWSVAFIFSVIHMQFYGLIPRMLLGAYLGYLLYWSKNIWVPILAHFYNNAIAVIGMANSDLKESEYISGEVSESEMMPFLLVTAVTLTLFYFCTNSLRKRLRQD